MENISEKELVKELLMHGVTYSRITKVMHLHCTRVTMIKNEMIEEGWNPKDITPYENDEIMEKRLEEIDALIRKALVGKCTHRGMKKEEYRALLKKRKEEAKTLLEQHMSLNQIAETMNISLSTVKKYLQDVDVQYADPHKEQAHLPVEFVTNFKIEWTRAVNRIRRYYGKEEFMEG